MTITVMQVANRRYPARAVCGRRVDCLVPALCLGRVVPVQLLQGCRSIALLSRPLHRRASVFTAEVSFSVQLMVLYISVVSKVSCTVIN